MYGKALRKWQNPTQLQGSISITPSHSPEVLPYPLKSFKEWVPSPWILMSKVGCLQLLLDFSDANRTSCLRSFIRFPLRLSSLLPVGILDFCQNWTEFFVSDGLNHQNLFSYLLLQTFLIPFSTSRSLFLPLGMSVFRSQPALHWAILTIDTDPAMNIKRWNSRGVRH